MEWTREKTLSLINEYRKRRGLWDMTHEDYRKKEMKQKLLVEVSQSLGGGIPILEIEKKFHTLRTQYHREIIRMKRKEPYNSKWFGFKTLQFLSSPKACRSGKGKIKSSDATEDGVNKFIIREVGVHDVSGSESASASNITEEFITINRKPATITFEAAQAAASAVQIGTVTVSNNSVHQKYESTRARDLEKLIEETTKDVDEPEESKPKISTMKEITIPIEHHTYSTATIAATETSEHLHHQQQQQQQQEQQQQQQQHHHHQHEQHIEEHNIETIDIQPADEITYQHHHAVPTVSHHQQHNHQQQQQQHRHITQSTIGNTTLTATTIHPARIIKIQRRDTCNEDEYYEEEPVHQQQQQQQQTQHLQGKRLYYDATGTTITNANSSIIATSSPPTTILTSSGTKLQQSQQQQQRIYSPFRDEFSTYGEYVANEMRTITNREVMIALKHKINTALFEANMAELQK